MPEPKTIHAAYAAAFAQIEGATKSANNPHFKSKYADLTSVIEAIKPALTAHGLFFTQCPQTCDGGITIETTLHHDSGQTIALGSLFMPANRNDAQAYGSALTYARRYALVTAFGVPTEDDDGNAASKEPPAKREAPAKPVDMPDAEWANLVQLIEATKSSTTAMVKHFGVKDLKHLDQAQYAQAVEMLNVKLEKAAKAQTDAELADEIPY